MLNIGFKICFNIIKVAFSKIKKSGKSNRLFLLFNFQRNINESSDIMKKTFTLILVSGLLLTSLTSNAQRDNRAEKGVVTVVNNDTVNARQVEKTLKENAPAAPNDNGLPRFALVGKHNQYYIGLGAQFLGEGVFDFGDNMSSPTLFIPSSITKAAPGNGGSLGFGWQSSSIYLNVVAMPGTDNQVGLFFKGNFMGNNNAFSVFHFYAKYRGLTAGYTTSLFTDGNAEPMTIDFEGPNGYPFINLFTASWTQNFNNHVSAAIGIDAPTASITTGDHSATVSQRIPAIPLYLQYAWNGGNSHIRLSGLVRPLQYRNLVKSENTTIVGGGVQLSGMAQVVGPLTFSYNAAYGKGFSNYLQDDNGLGLDAVATTEPGKIEGVKSMGLTAGLSYAFTPSLSANMVYSHLTNWLPDKAVVDGSQYRYGDYAVANIIYNVNRFVSAGIEYDYGHRKSFGGESLHSNRIQVQFGVTF